MRVFLPIPHSHWNYQLRRYESCQGGEACPVNYRLLRADSAGEALQPPASPLGAERPVTPGSDMGAAEVASSAGPAARSPVAVNVVSELHHSLRFLLQKHHRVIVAALRWDFGGAGELDHAEQMLDAAITDFEALLEQIIDRRIANRASPTGTFYLGGRL